MKKNKIVTLLMIFMTSIIFSQNKSIPYYNWLKDSIKLISVSLDSINVEKTFYFKSNTINYNGEIYYFDLRKKASFSYNKKGISEYIEKIMTQKLPYKSSYWFINVVFFINKYGRVDDVWLSGNSKIRGVLFDEELYLKLIETSKYWKPAKRKFKDVNNMVFARILL